MTDRRTVLFRLASAGTAGLAGVGNTLAPPPAATLNSRLTGALAGIHDPVIIMEGDIYHVFGSGGWWGKPGPSWRVSRDLANLADNGSPFDATPQWARKAIQEDATMWAPDIAFVDGVYRLYYSVSTAGSMRSVTGFATTKTLDRASRDYGRTDHGLVIESHHGGDHNVIDANLVVDADGAHWLAFGSFWSGLKLIRLDRRTGKPASGAPLHSIAYRPAPAGGDNPVEGAFIFRRAGWYYLFASYDYCCKKEQSNYYVAVGPSRVVTGPYRGRDGKSMMDGYGTAVIVERPWASTRWRGPGHCELMRDGARDVIVFHAYDTENGARPTLRIAELKWDAAGWPTALT